eukprot:4310193-Heterocapsa_arctica.AAC.1
MVKPIAPTLNQKYRSWLRRASLCFLPSTTSPVVSRSAIRKRPRSSGPTRRNMFSLTYYVVDA